MIIERFNYEYFQMKTKKVDVLHYDGINITHRSIPIDGVEGLSECLSTLEVNNENRKFETKHLSDTVYKNIKTNQQTHKDLYERLYNSEKALYGHLDTAFKMIWTAMGVLFFLSGILFWLVLK